MMDSQDVAFVEGRNVWFYGKRKVVELKDLTAEVILLLNKQSSGMNGVQLARELSVTPSAVTKVAKELLKLGMIRKESLPVSQNVKLYSLAIRVMNENDFEDIRKHSPSTLLEILTKKLGGNEKMALFYVQQMNGYLKSLPEPDRAKVVRSLMEEITGREIKDKA